MHISLRQQAGARARAHTCTHSKRAHSHVQGIGLGIAECMAKAGADIVLLDLPPRRASEAEGPDPLDKAYSAVEVNKTPCAHCEGDG